MPPIAETMYQRVERLIREEITSGRWPEAMPLPSESELSALHGVSRGTVRQALAALRQEGLIRGGRGKSPVVSHTLAVQPFSAFMSFTQWAQQAGHAPGQFTIEIERRLADDQTTDLMQLDPDNPQVVQVLRLRTLDGRAAMLVRSHYRCEAGDLLFEIDTNTVSFYDYLSERGINLVHGRHVIDAVLADRVDAEHLHVPVGSALLRERRISVGDNGVVLECAEHRYPPQIANFVIENSLDARAATSRVSLV